MATVRNSLVVDRAGLDGLLAPRHDVLDEELAPAGFREVPSGSIHQQFDVATGPVRSYRRTVDAETAGDGRFRVVEETDFEMAIPVWGALFVWPMRRELRRMTGRDRSRHPFWAPPARMDRRASTILGLLCTASLVGGFLGTLITQTITYATDSFHTTKTVQSATLAAVRAGVLGALVLVALADRHGRKKLLIYAGIGSCVAAVLGAAAPNMLGLGITQTVSRGLSMTLVMLVTVVAAEEMPAGSRAYSISVMTMTGALGAGMCLWSLPLTGLGPDGWRIIYLIPVLGIPVMLYVGRHLPESQRFTTPHVDATVLTGHGRRIVILAVSFFLISSFGAPATQLLNDFLKDERGFSATRISLFTLLTTTPGGIGLVIGGRLADVKGKRVIVALGVIGGAALTLFQFQSSGWPMWMWSLVGTVMAAAAGPALGMYGPELFPTGSRARANGIIQVVSVAGSAVGLLVAGAFNDRGQLVTGLRWLLLGPLVAGAIVVFLFPETARRELEDLNPEDQAPTRPGSATAPPAVGVGGLDPFPAPSP